MSRNISKKLSKNKFAFKKYTFSQRKRKSMKFKIAHNTNQNFENKLGYYKPIKIWHLKYLSKYFKQSIHVWFDGREVYSVGKSYRIKPAINVELIKNKLKTHTLGIDHFTLKGKREVALIEENILPNDCLLNVIYAQTGHEAIVQRRLIMRKESMKRRKRNPPIWQKCLSLSDLRGGAKYAGMSKKDAKKILNYSQKGRSHPDQLPGHPRAHASYPQATGLTDSIENYSKFGMKTGFLSRTNQDLIAHLSLITNEAQDTLEILNDKGKTGKKEFVSIRPKDLAIDNDKLLQAQEWFQGEKLGEPGRINRIRIVMKHFYDKYDDEDADVFILTLYPTL